MEKKVTSYIEEHGLLKRGDRVLVGVSGGPDSMVLLQLLHSLAPRWGLELHAAHLHHGLRRGDADRDRELARRVCRELKVPFASRKVDVRDLAAKKGLSLEDAARRARYALFSRVARRKGIGILALGHTADDQAETFLMRLLRGAGGRGLGCMAPSRPGNGFTVVRPMLGVWKREVLSHARARGVPYRLDKSNRDLSFTRNRVRHRLIPYLERGYNPGIRETLRRCAEVVGAEHSHIENAARLFFSAEAGKSGGRITLPVGEILELPRALAAEVVRLALATAGSPAAGYADLKAVLALCRGEGGRKVHHLPGCAAVREYGTLLFGKAPRESAPEYEFPLRDGLELRFAPFPVRWGIRVLAKRCAGRLTKESPSLAEVWGGGGRGFSALVERFSWDLLEGKGLTVRNRRPGDRYRPLGAGGAKKLKRLMIDEKLPVALRRAVPVLACDGEPLWLAGYRIADGFRVTRATRRVLEVRVEKSGPA